MRRAIPFAIYILVAVLGATSAIADIISVDLQAKIYAPSEIRPGTTGVWNINVIDIGYWGIDWHLSFPIPLNSSLVQVVPLAGGGTCTSPNAGATSGTIDCSGTGFASLNFASFDVYLMAPPTLLPGQTIHATLTASSSVGERDPSNNVATFDTLVVTRADIRNSVSGPNTVYPGDLADAWFEAWNNGPDSAAGVVQNMTLPPGAVVFSESSNYGNCITPISCTVASFPVTPFSLDTYTLENPWVVHMRFVAPATPGTYRLASEVSWTDPDLLSFDPAKSWWDFTVIPRPLSPDLSLFVDPPPAASAGDLVTYTIHVTNGGTGAASNVSLRQSSSKPAVFVSSSAHCSADTKVSCSLGTLASGAWATLTITERMTEPGEVTSVFTVATDTPEDHTSNNTATASVNVAAPPARRRAARH